MYNYLYTYKRYFIWQLPYENTIQYLAIFEGGVCYIIVGTDIHEDRTACVKQHDIVICLCAAERLIPLHGDGHGRIQRYGGALVKILPRPRVEVVQSANPFK